LIGVQVPEVVDGAEGRRVVVAQRLLPPGQRSLAELLTINPINLVVMD
jgi:2-keto-3-deoxy-L-rhamnonate aldolase RhmA